MNTDVTNHPDFWDCECEKNYIRPKKVNQCLMCGAIRENQPDSRANEVYKAFVTPTPWSDENHNFTDPPVREIGLLRERIYELDKWDFHRACACVNALSGIEDPAAWVAVARKALELCEKMGIRIEEVEG